MPTREEIPPTIGSPEMGPVSNGLRAFYQCELRSTSEAANAQGRITEGIVDYFKKVKLEMVVSGEHGESAI
jgi:hypothetical protein